MVYLVFPDTSFETVKKESLKNGDSFDWVECGLIAISSLPNLGSFSDWKRSAQAGKITAKENEKNKALSHPPFQRVEFRKRFS